MKVYLAARLEQAPLMMEWRRSWVYSKLANPVLRRMGLSLEPNVVIGEPYNNATGLEDRDVIVVWHVPVLNAPRHARVTPRPAERCGIEIGFMATNGMLRTVDGRWTSDDGPVEFVDLVAGEARRDCAVILRAIRGGSFAPGMVRRTTFRVEAAAVHILGKKCLVDGDNSERLNPGKYNCTIRVYSGKITLAKKNFLIYIPREGLRGFVLQEQGAATWMK